MDRFGVLGLAVATLIAILAALSSVALAFEPTGACCLVGGLCEDLISFTCEQQGGVFIGHGTECSQTACATSLTAPMLSIFGLVSAVGVLAGVGLYRLLFRSR
jgi:hypothetical protein